MKSHSFDGISFFTGLIIAVIGLVYLIPDTPTDIWNALGRLGSWAWPILLLAIGVAVLIPAVIPKKEAEPDQIDSDAV